MKLMYPHPVDRFRFIQRLATSARLAYRPGRPGMEQCGISQEALARRATVSQATVSNIENLEKTIHSSSRRVRREDFLKVLTWGLEMVTEDIDALLWLFDGEPLREDEIRRYVRGYQPQAARRRVDEAMLRQRVLDRLRAAIDRAFEPESCQTAAVRVFSGDERGRIAVDRALYELEHLPGQRLLATALPTSVALVQTCQRADRDALDELLPPDLPPESRHRMQDRVDIHLYNLENYGERSIHSKPSLERYLSADSPHRLSLEHRRAYIRRWCELVRSYKHYEVALADATPDLEPVIKSTKQAMLRAAHHDGYIRERDWHRGGWGPRYLLWLDEVSVTSFLLDFEAHWQQIPLEYRSKDSVLAWIEERLRA
jgi:transcriptional regulator with XRE-family HTH domain